MLKKKHNAERYSKGSKGNKNGRFLVILEVVIREPFVGLLGVFFFFSLTWFLFTSKFVHKLCNHGFEVDLMKNIYFFKLMTMAFLTLGHDLRDVNFPLCLC